MRAQPDQVGLQPHAVQVQDSQHRAQVRPRTSPQRESPSTESGREADGAADGDKPNEQADQHQLGRLRLRARELHCWLFSPLCLILLLKCP